LLPGENYSVSGSSIRPGLDYNGQLSVAAILEDAGEVSNTLVLNIDVIPVNDAPVITEVANFSMESNSALTILRENVLIEDPDTDPASLMVRVLAGENYSFSGLTITPKINFVGTLRVGVQASDATVVSEIFYTSIEVMPITGLEDGKDDKLHVYPNPAQTFVHIEHRIPILELLMIAIDGKKYPIEQIIDGNQASADISHLPSGTYFLSIKTKNGETWKKIVVIR
jgi:hypothetical protein